MWSITPILVLFLIAGASASELSTVTQFLVDRFMTTMESFYNQKDQYLIAGLLDTNFTFRTCFESLSHSQSIATMTSFSFESSTYKVLNITDEEEYVKLLVSIGASGQSNIQFNFVLRKFNEKLISVEFKQCPNQKLRRKKFAGLVTKDSNSVIERFLDALKQSMITRDLLKIGKMLDQKFVFKRCQRSYNKEESVAHISRISSEANVDVTLKTSNWNDFGQIEYTVTVTGAHNFDAQFVYCPYRNVLKSGSILSCPSRRM